MVGLILIILFIILNFIFTFVSLGIGKVDFLAASKLQGPARASPPDRKITRDFKLT